MKSVNKIRRGPDSQAPRKRGWLPKAASAAALALSLSLTACSHDYSLAWVYAPSASLTSGLINAYRVDYQNGQLTLLPDSPIPSGGRKPSGIVATPAGKGTRALYVIHHDDSNVVSFLIGSDGKLYPQQTYDTGSFPTAIAISPDGKFLYIAYTYQDGYTTASPGPGGISVFPINADGSLGAINKTPILAGRAPVGIAVGNNGGTVYVISQDSAAVNTASTSAADTTLNLFAFTADGSGNLTPVAGQSIVSGNHPSSGFATGTLPASITTDASGSHLYVTDGTGNIVISYNVASNGVPTAIAGGTAATGKGPQGMTLDPTGKLFFVANNDGTISGYNIGSNGAPTLSASAASTASGADTTCVTIEPTRGIYLYASNSLGNSITGEEIESTGALRPIFHSPYEAATLPVCAIAVANPTAGQ